MLGIPHIEPYDLPSPADLPASVAPWSPDPARAVLLVHDMQRYFVEPLPATVRVPLVSTIAALRDRCTALGVPVAYTAQPGDMSDEQRGLLKSIWGRGMRRTEAERAVVAELSPHPQDWRFDKLRYSAFFQSGLLDRIRASGRDQLLLCGVYAHIGVLATAVEAFSNDLQTFMIADALADFSAAHHQMALDYAASLCAVVLGAKEVFG